MKQIAKTSIKTAAKNVLYFIQLQRDNGTWANCMTTIDTKLSSWRNGFRSVKEAGKKLQDLQERTKGNGFNYRIAPIEVQDNVSTLRLAA